MGAALGLNSPGRCVLRIVASLPLKEALALVDIRLLDHIIVGDGVCVSLAELGAHAAVLGRSIRVSLTRWRS